MAPHSSTLAWQIPWMEEPGRLQSMGSLGVRHDWATSLSLFTFMHWRRKWQPTPVFLSGESQGQGSLMGCRLWVAQSQTWLKRLSSSSSSSQDSVGFTKEFELTIRTYDPGYSDLYQLIHLLVSESKAKEWIEKAGWKDPLADFEWYKPQDQENCKELAHKLLKLIPEPFPQVEDWSKIQ